MPASRRQTALLMLAIGGHGLAVQVVLMRELMSAYAGNELTAAVVLSAWLGVEALGAWLGGTLRIGPGRLASAAVVAAVASVLTVPAAVLSRPLFGLLGGEQPGLAVVVGAAALAASVPAFLHGLLFVAGCGRCAAHAGPAGIGHGYAWEGLGTAAAGAATAAVLLLAVPGLAVVAGFGVLLLLACLADAPSVPVRATVILAAVTLAALIPPARALERLTWQKAWPGFRVAEVRDSWFGKTVLLDREGERTVVYDGVVVATSSPARAVETEQSTVVPLLYAGNHLAGAVLLLDGNLNAVEPLLRLPGVEVTLVSADRVLFERLRTVSPGRTADPRLRVVFDDPRRFLRRDPGTYDCIIGPGAAPASLAANRLATAEFYALCRQRLRPGGVVAVSPSAVASGIGPTTARLLASRLATLTAAFDTVQVLALDSPLLLASSALPRGPEEAVARLADWQAAAPDGGGSLDPTGLARLLDPFRQQRLVLEIRDATMASPVAANRDWHPRAFFLALAHGIRDGSRGDGLPLLPGRAPAWLLGAVLLAAAALVLYAARRGTAARRAVAVTTSGFAASALVALGMFVFQVATGALYAGVILLLTCFMLGTVLGGWLGGRAHTATRNTRRTGFLCAELTLIAAPLLMVLAGRHLPGWTQFALLAAVGWAVGFEFPVAAASGTPSLQKRVGFLTAADLTGGVLGGALVPLVALPAAGLSWAYLFLVALKLASLLLQPLPRRRV